MLIKSIFTPIKIGPVEIRNRIVMPAIMGLGFASANGTVSQTRISCHEAQAKGGVGLIITGGVTVDPLMVGSSLHIGLWDDRFIPGLQELADAIHAHGAKLAPQIMHQGARRIPALSGAQAVAPSAIRPREKSLTQTPRELTVEEIEGLVEQFGQSARRAREAGCDAVELHAAHGSHNLVSSFMSPLCNKRTDAYGGSLEGLLKFPLQIIASMKERAGADFPIIVRISGDEIEPGGRTLLETEAMVPMLVEAGADALHVSGGSFPETPWWVIPPTGTPLGLNVSAAEAIKKRVDVPVIVAGRIKDPLMAEHIITSDKADMVAIGRAILADPEMPNKMAAGNLDDIVPCIGCNVGCLGSARSMGKFTCVVNPTLGREKEMSFQHAKDRKKIVVVGGGLGGLYAAWIAGLRGHDVMLYEKASKLGGQFNLASIPPLVHENALLVKFLSNQVQKVGCTVASGAEATAEMVRNLSPDVVVVATGGTPCIPNDIPGIRNDNVLTAHDVLAGNAVVREENVVVIGGGMVGCEVADFLAEPEDNAIVGPISITILEILDNVAADMRPESRYLLLQNLRRKGVKWITKAKVQEITDDGIVYIRDGQEETISGIGCIILATGTSPNNTLAQSLQGAVPEIYTIGDAREPRSALEAIAEAAEISWNI